MKKQVRIRGLVRALNRVRQHLQAGVRPEDVDALRRQAAQAVARTEAICQAAGVRPSALPAPSRNAYRFLKGIDFDAIPIISHGSAQARPLRLRNVVAGARECHRRAWLLANHDEEGQTVEDLLADVQQRVDSIESVCRRAGSTPSALTTPSRNAFALLKFLSHRDNLTAHVDTVRRMAKHARSHARLGTAPLVVEMANNSHLWQCRQSPDETRLQLNICFIGAHDAALDAIARAALRGKSPTTTRIIDDYYHGDACREVLAELELAAGELPMCEAGCVYDLGDVFDRVSERYFGAALDRPRLTWSQVVTYRKFGHYAFATDTVLVSVSLDSPDVPPQVLDYVMYHELLHKKLGLALCGQRRVAHTPAFRRAEKRFTHFAQVTQFLDRYARKLQSRR